MWENIDRKDLVGMRIVVIEDHDNANITNFTGRIIGLTEGVGTFISIMVELDQPFRGHSCGGVGTEGCCWNIPLEKLVPEIEIQGPPVPEHIKQERKIIEKAKKLWNNSKYVKSNPKLVY